jgi:hypothetical protein
MDSIKQPAASEKGLKTATMELENAIRHLHAYVKHGSVNTVAEDVLVKEGVESKSEIERLTRRLVNITRVVEEIKRNINLE